MYSTKILQVGCHSYTKITDEKNGYNAGPGNKSQILFRLFPMCTNIAAGTKIKINYGPALSDPLVLITSCFILW